MSNVPKIRSFSVFAISPEKQGDEVDSLPGDNHESFLQVDSITLGVHNQACPRNPKQQVCNIFAISQWKCEWWSWLFACW